MLNLVFSFTFAHCFAAPVLHVFSCQLVDIDTPELDFVVFICSTHVCPCIFDLWSGSVCYTLSAKLTFFLAEVLHYHIPVALDDAMMATHLMYYTTMLMSFPFFTL